MANEFKVKKGLIVDGSNTVLDIQGTQGQLFSVTDSLIGDLFSVSDVSGVPIFNVNSSGTIEIDGSTTSTGTLSSKEISIKQQDDAGFNAGLTIERSANTQKLHIGMDGGAVNFNSPDGLSYKFRNNGTEKVIISGAGNVSMATGHSSGKFAVMSTSVHGSYDFYNNGTSYFNGAVSIDSNITQTGATIASFHNQVGVGTQNPYAFDTTATKLHVKNPGSSGSVVEVARFEGSSDGDGSGGVIRLTTSNDRGMYFQAGRTGTAPYAEIGTTEYDGAKTLAITLDNSGNTTFAEAVLLPDGKKLEFGGGGDLKIYHDAGSNSYIEEQGEGALVFKSNDFHFQNQSGTISTAFQITPGGNSHFTGTVTASNLSNTNTGDQTLPTDFVSAANGGAFAAPITVSGGGNTLLLKKGTGTAAIALGGASAAPEASFLMEGIAGGGGKFYTSTSTAGTIADPGWSPKLTIAQDGTATFTGVVKAPNFLLTGTDGFNLPSGGFVDWANGDARIVEGLINNYSLSFQTYDGTNLTSALRLDGDNQAVFHGNIKVLAAAMGTTQADGDYIAKLYTASADGFLELFTGEGTPVSRIKLSSYGDSYINAASTAKFGIGTSTPQKIFHVEHAAGASEGILISGASDTVGHTAGILLRSEGGEADSALRAKGAIFFEREAGDYGTGKLIFANNGSNSNATATLADRRMTIANDGDIFIGRDSTHHNYGGKTLTIGGTRATLSLISSGGLSTVAMHSNNATAKDVHINQNGTDGSISFYQYSVGQTAHRTLMLSGAGNLGVGDGTPSSLSSNTYSLTVNSGRTDLSGALFSKSNGTIKHQQYWDSSGYGNYLAASSGDLKWKIGTLNNMTVSEDGGLDIQGTAGQLFSVTNSLVGDLLSVSDVSGVPIFNVNSSGAVDIDGTLKSTGDITVHKDAPKFILKDIGTGNAMTSEYAFHDGNGVSRGYLGYGSSNNSVMYLQNTLGEIHFHTSGGLCQTLSGGNTTFAGTITAKATTISPTSASGTATVFTLNHGSGSHTGIGMQINSANSGHALNITGSVGGNYARITSAYNNAPDFFTSGTITAGQDVIAYSDAKLKENINTLDGSKVLKMRGVSFDRIDTGLPSSGVIAQEMQKVAPELVNEIDGTLGVSYGNLVGYLIEAVKDQQKQIDELKKLIK